MEEWCNRVVNNSINIKRFPALDWGPGPSVQIKISAQQTNVSRLPTRRHTTVLIHSPGAAPAQMDGVALTT